MGDNEEIRKKKRNISNEVKNQELTEILVALICFLILTCLFGYIGYHFCLDNNYDIQRGIVFGALFPLGLAILKELDLGRVLPYIAYIVLYIIALDYIPTFVGILILSIFILIFIVSFLSVIKKHRTQEVNKADHYHPVNTTTHIVSAYYRTTKTSGYEETSNIENEETRFSLPEDEYECERCFRKISAEDYDLYDGMCEECFDETHYDFSGNPREDYWNY